MRYRITDIETIGHPEANTWFDPCEPDPKLLEPIEFDSRLKDPVKVEANRADVERKRAERPALIAASIEARNKERAERFGLNADTCRIVALGWHDVGYGEPRVRLCLDEAQEAAALTEYWRTYREQFTKIVTFNGERFDLPVMVMRSIYLDVDYPELVIRPEWKSPHVDLYQVLSVQGARKDVGSLRFYARRCGFGTLDKVDGSQIAQLVADGRWQEVHDHCLSDLGLTHALANRLKQLKLAPEGAYQDAVI